MPDQFTSRYFSPYHMLRDASPKQIADMVDRCQNGAAMTRDVIFHLLAVGGSLDDALAHYQTSLRVMQNDTAEAIRRNLMIIPGIRLHWTVKDAGARTRECVGVIVGPEANVDPPACDDLSDIIHRQGTNIYDVSKTTGIPLRNLVEWVGGQGKVKKECVWSLGKLLDMTSKQVIRAFYEGCRRAARANPELRMYPEKEDPKSEAAREKMFKPKPPTIAVQIGIPQTVLNQFDGHTYKILIEKVE